MNRLSIVPGNIVVSLMRRVSGGMFLGLGLLLMAPRPVRATIYNWDPNGAGSPGGSGIWDDSTANWSNAFSGGSDVPWPNSNPNADEAYFGGPGGTVSLDPSGGSIFVNNLTFGNAYTLNGPATGNVTLNLSGTNATVSIGSLSITLNARIGGTHGLYELGTGNLILGGDNSGLSGTVTVGQQLSLASASAGSANATWNTNNGLLTYLPSLGGTNQTIQLGALTGSGELTNSGTAGVSDVITFAIGGVGANSTFLGDIQDSSVGDRTALTKVSTQTLTLANINSYSGPTTIAGGSLIVQGTIANSSSIVLMPGGTVMNPVASDLSLQPKSTTVNQIGDATPVTMNGGELDYLGTYSGTFNEAIGAFNIASGQNAIMVTSPGSANLTAARLDRPAGGGVVMISGSSLGSSISSTATISHLLISTPPLLIGSGPTTTGDTPGQFDTPIIPFAVGFSNSGMPNTFLTYSPAGGVRPLNAADEFNINEIASGDNTLISAGIVAPASATINSLVVTGTGSLTIPSGGTLNIGSGAILLDANRNPAIQANGSPGTISFNNGEAIISSFASDPLVGTIPVTISANLANLTQLTLAGYSGTSAARLVLNQTSATTDSAPVFMQSSTLSVAQDYDLGYATGTGAITFPLGSSATLQLTGAQFTTTKGISLQGNGVFYTASSADHAVLGGVISGVGSLRKTGPGTIVLSAQNTYSGMTAVDGGTLNLHEPTSNNNIPDSWLILAGASAATGGILDASDLAITGGFQLRAGQTLAGFGTVDLASFAQLTVSSGSTISAGDGVAQTGRLYTAGGQTWNGGGTYLWKIDLTNAGTAGAFNSDKTGAHWDQLTMTSLAVAATSANPFQINIVGLPGTGTNDFNPSSSYKWVAANTPSATLAGNLFNSLKVSVSGFSNYKTSGSFSAAFAPTGDPGFEDLVITYSPVPEPTSILLLAPAGCVLVLRLRRRDSVWP